MTDESVDVKKIERIPLYVEWRGRKVRVSEIKRSTYFLSSRVNNIIPPTFRELKEWMERFSKGGKVTVFLPSWPMNFIKNTLTVISSILDEINVEVVETDSVILAHILENELDVERMEEISRRAKTYLFFSDLSFLRKNSLLLESKGVPMITKSVNLVKYAHGKISVKTSWKIKGIVSSVLEETKGSSLSVYVYHAGNKRMANMLATSFLKKFKCRMHLGWMNPVLASQFGRRTVSVTIVPEV